MKMKIAGLVFASALVACDVWARLGETAEQAETRYGAPTDIMPSIFSLGSKAVSTNDITRVIKRHYNKGEIDIYAYFFTNKAGVTVIGEIQYEPRNFDLSDDVRKQLFDANSNGEMWEKYQVGMSWNWKTKIAVARQGSLGGFVFSLHEYIEFVEATEAEHKRLEQEKLKKDQEGF